MKISLEWLKEYVDITETAEQLKEDLTMNGLLVESILEENGDPVLEIEITSNRPDCLSHIGIAREVSALYRRPLRRPPVQSPLIANPDRIDYSIEIRDPDLCPRYVGLVMDGIKVGPSPTWMQKRLEAAGMRALNNIVDITNYVLLEFGHPLHAFDFQLLRQGKIVVSRAKDGQWMQTLDGVGRELDSQMLLINDGEGPVAIAGVMGGLNSEISEQTDTVLLECAYFAPASVRRTSKKLGLSTEASYRFERGADWENTVPAIARTCYLIEKLAGGRVAGSVKDAYPRPKEPAKLHLQLERAESLLGVNLSESFVESTLERLNFRLERESKGAWLVTSPTYRVDIELEADLVEELARFHGYQNIPTTVPTAKTLGTHSPVFKLESRIREILLGMGYNEAVNLSFASEAEHRVFPPLSGERVAVRNPLTEETQYLRTSLIPGLVKAAKRNFNYGQQQIRLFEIGKVYSQNESGVPSERRAIGILGTGGFAEENWTNPGPCYDYFHMKGMIAALMTGLNSAEFDVGHTDRLGWLDAADASLIQMGESTVGFAGSLGPALQEEYKLKQAVYIAELDFDLLSRYVFTPIRYVPLAKYPKVERDLSVILNREIAYGAIRTGISGLGITELISIDLTDIYEGEKIPAGKLSMTLRLTFQDREKTLTVDRVQGFSDTILTFLSNTYGAGLRRL